MDNRILPKLRHPHLCRIPPTRKQNRHLDRLHSLPARRRLQRANPNYPTGRPPPLEKIPATARHPSRLPSLKPVPINYANYNPEWPYLRELISHRELNRCKICRAPHRVMIWRLKSGAWSPHVRGKGPRNAVRAILCICSVAHLDWDRTNDHHKNLALLCQRCHLDHDRPQHLWGLRLKRRQTSKQLEFADDPQPKPRRVF